MYFNISILIAFIGFFLFIVLLNRFLNVKNDSVQNIFGVNRSFALVSFVSTLLLFFYIGYKGYEIVTTVTRETVFSEGSLFFAQLALVFLLAGIVLLVTVFKTRKIC